MLAVVVVELSPEERHIENWACDIQRLTINMKKSAGTLYLHAIYLL